MKIGDKIKLENQKQRFTVKALSDRYAILTKPFNPKHTVIYTIIDFKERKRNRNDFIFSPYNYAKQKDIDKCLKDLEAGECHLSYRGIRDLEDYITKEDE